MPSRRAEQEKTKQEKLQAAIAIHGFGIQSPIRVFPAASLFGGRLTLVAIASRFDRNDATPTAKTTLVVRMDCHPRGTPALMRFLAGCGSSPRSAEWLACAERYPVGVGFEIIEEVRHVRGRRVDREDCGSPARPRYPPKFAEDR